MTREQAQTLLETYRNFPKSKVFALRPYNYPLFHLLESFAKGWRIESTSSGQPIEVNDLDFEALASAARDGVHLIWRFVARNPQLVNTTLGFVQEDLYARYVGKCTPLRGPLTSWTFFPNSVIKETENGRPAMKETFDEFLFELLVGKTTKKFNGLIGKHTRLYQIEIDLSTTDIFGKRNPDVPWHYLQQTIDWKPWTGRIDWNETDHAQDPQPETTGGHALRDRFNRVIATA